MHNTVFLVEGPVQRVRGDLRTLRPGGAPRQAGYGAGKVSAIVSDPVCFGHLERIRIQLHQQIQSTDFFLDVGTRPACSLRPDQIQSWIVFGF